MFFFQAEHAIRDVAVTGVQTCALPIFPILAFLVLGSAWLFGIGFPKVGFANYTAYGGFLPHGWSGVGLGVILGLFSFFGIEVVGSTAGEAANPKEAVPKALRSTVATLILFYVAGLALVVGIVPWKQIDKIGRAHV